MSRTRQKLDRVFAALANQHRRSILHTLSLQPASISDLAKQEQLSLPAIHKHIKVMEQANLLQRKRKGRCNFLALERAGLKALQDWVRQYHTHWGSGSETLANYVERINN